MGAVSCTSLPLLGTVGNYNDTDVSASSVNWAKLFGILMSNVGRISNPTYTDRFYFSENANTLT